MTKLGLGIPGDHKMGKAIEIASLSLNNWNYRMIGLDDSIGHNKGAGINIGIIDSGYTVQPDLPLPTSVKGFGFKNGLDENGHGTHVYGIVANIAPNAHFYVAKVLDKNGVTDKYSNVEQAIYWLVNDCDAHVINISLGMRKSVGIIKMAIEYAKSRGVTVVCAGGNAGKNKVMFPARMEECIAVGAIDKFRNLAPFSNTGQEIDLVAPGMAILSNYPDGSMRYANGTSQAAPHVTGIVALLMDNYLTKKQIKPQPFVVKNILYRNAADLGVIGWDKSTGHGLAQCYFNGGKRKSKRGSKFERYMKWVARVFIYFAKQHLDKEEQKALGL